MRMGVISLIVFIAFLVGGITLIYYLYEVPKQEEDLGKYVNLSISASEYGKNELINTNYEIYSNDSLFRSGKTLSSSYVFDHAFKNDKVVVINKNNASQNYYSYRNEISTIYDKIYRVNLKLKEAGNLSISQEGVFGEDKTIYLNITTDTIFKNLRFCLKWSSHIVYAKIYSNLVLIEKPEEFSSYDKCFDTNISLENIQEWITIPISYEWFNTLEEDDYILFTFYDDNVVKINNENIFPEPFTSTKINYTLDINNI